MYRTIDAYFSLGSFGSIGGSDAKKVSEEREVPSTADPMLVALMIGGLLLEQTAISGSSVIEVQQIAVVGEEGSYKVGSYKGTSTSRRCRSQVQLACAQNRTDGPSREKHSCWSSAT